MFGERIIRLQETASTNEAAKDEARRGAPEGTVVVAVSQSSGKGRLARKWFSPPGGLWATVILRPSIPPGDVPKLTAVCAVAVAETLRAEHGLDAVLKWPNDVLVGGRKVCGILAEAATGRDGIEFAVIGIGLNANNDTDDLPAEVAAVTTSVAKASGREADVEGLLRAVLERFEMHYRGLCAGKFAEVGAAYRGMMSTVGRRVKVTIGDRTIEGRAVAVDDGWALVVEDAAGKEERILAGDCVHCETENRSS